MASTSRHHPNPLCESSSASNICNTNRGISANRINSLNFFTTANRDLYGTIESIASNGLSTDQTNSTRSSIYSDKTILNEQISPQLCTAADDLTKKFASNATGSRISLQTKLIEAKQTKQTLSPTQESESNDQSM